MNLRSRLCASSAIAVVAIAVCLPGRTSAGAQVPGAAPASASGSNSPGTQTAGGGGRAKDRKIRKAGSTVNPPPNHDQPPKPDEVAAKPAGPELDVSPGQILFPPVQVTRRSGPQIVTLT